MPEIKYNYAGDIEASLNDQIKPDAAKYDITSKKEINYPMLEDIMDKGQILKDSLKSEDKENSMLKCPSCNSVLSLSLGYTGADWLTVAGEGSGYNWQISLECNNVRCARVFPLLHVKDSSSVSPVIDNLRYFINRNL